MLPRDLTSIAPAADAALVLRGPVITNVSASVRELLGWDPTLCLDRTLREVFDDAWSDVKELQDQAAAAIGHTAIQTDVRLTHVDGQDVWVDVLVVDRPSERVQLVVLTDVGGRRAADGDGDGVDAATGLLDRTGLLRRTEVALTRADAADRAVTVVALTYADPAGADPAGPDPAGADPAGADSDGADSDGADRQRAVALTAAVRAGDDLARTGPGCFAVVVRDLDPEQLEVTVADVVGRLADACGPEDRPRTGVATHLPVRRAPARMLAEAVRNSAAAD